MMKYIPTNTEIVSHIGVKISSCIRKRSLQTIVFFDLVGSTVKKLSAGHEKGTEDSLKAILLFRSVINHHNGCIVKELGDGVLARFDDPLKSAIAGLDILTLSLDLGIQVKGAITLGLVDLLELEFGFIDVMGSAVDRCFRIESFCLPGQLLVDKPYLDAVGSFLASYENIQVSEGKIRFLTSIGDTELFEINCSEIGLKKYIYTDFRIHEKGRIPLHDKVNFVKSATAHVIEIGTGLRTFSGFFSGQRPAEFRKYIENLVIKGVNVTILALDPEWNGAPLYLTDRNEPDYKTDIIRSLKDLKDEQQRIRKLGVKGKFEIRLYQTYPFGHILCVDPDDDLFGRIFVSYYLPGVMRAECPVLEFSVLSNKELFEKHLSALNEIINHKSRIL